jgi:hypothetical protein
MKIAIHDKRKIFDLQEDFTASFPFLRLEFFAKPSRSGGASSKKIIRNNRLTIGQCRTIHESGHLSITPHITVSELKQRFEDVYGIHVQLFRKSGKVWINTSVTSSWTLEEQNKQGEVLSNAFIYKA